MGKSIDQGQWPKEASRSDKIVLGRHADSGKPRSAHEQLARIEAALRRIEEGRYGLCVGCSDPLDVGQLSANPATAFCDECLNQFEARKGC